MEKRNHRRFRIQPGVIGVLMPPWPQSTTVGEILDMSAAGLALRYVGDDEGSATNRFELSITCPHSNFYLPKLPVRVVSDFDMEQPPSNSMAPRRTCLKFELLTPDQESHVEKCIVKYRNR